MTEPRVSTDPVACLAEIAEVSRQRINCGPNVSTAEAFTLGRIMGIASRVPGVLVDD